MTAAEFRRLRSESVMTHVELAQRLQVDEMDILRYEIGALPIPPLVEYAVLWIIQGEKVEAFFSGN